MLIIDLRLICGFLVLVSICQVMPVDGAIDDYGPMMNDAKDSVQSFKYINHADPKNDDNLENDHGYDDEDDDDDENEDSDGGNNGNKDDSDEEGGAQKGGDSERSDKSGSKR